jgi:iron complex transport system permease protein
MAQGADRAGEVSTRSNVWKTSHARGRWTVTALLLSLAVALVVALMCGRYPIAPGELLHLLGQRLTTPDAVDSPAATVLFNVRIPRVFAAVLVGLALAGAGACYQNIFRNPMVDPSLLGVSAGAAFGAALGILFSLNVVMIQCCSFGCGLAAVLITIMLSRLVSQQGENTLTLVLCGIVTGTVFAALLSLIKYAADPYAKLPAITYWLMGSLAAVNGHDAAVAGVVIAVGLLPLLLLRWRVNVLALGDEEARTLGVNTGRIRLAVILGSTLVTASAIAISGMIGWIGLVVPHLARMLVGPSFPVLLPASLLLGALFLLAVDTLTRLLFAVEIPLGILTALVGAPFFVYLLIRRKRGWA